MGNPKISIIVPVFNVEAYISECLDSVVSQTLKEIEIIIINDGSEDESIDIVNEYAKNDSRIKIFKQQNAGLSVARNTGVKHAAGEYVLFVDSDDWIEKNTCEILYCKALKKNSDVLVFNYYLVLEHRNIKRLTYFSPHIISGKEYIKQSLKDNLFSPSAWNKLIRTEIARSLFFKPGHYHEDIEYSFSLMLLSKRVSTINNYLYYYRRFREGAITQKLKYKHLKDLVAIFEAVERKMKHSGLRGVFKAHFFNNYKYEKISMELLYRLIDDTGRCEESVMDIVRTLKKYDSFKKLSFEYFKHGTSFKHKLVMIAFWVSPNLYMVLGQKFYPLLKKLRIAV